MKSRYIPQPDDAEKVWVTIWLNGSPKLPGCQITKGFMRRVRLWAIDRNLDIVIVRHHTRSEPPQDAL